MGRSWKTTTLGVLSLIVTVANSLQTILTGGHLDLPATLVGITTGLGLIQAKDHNVTGGSFGNK